MTAVTFDTLKFVETLKVAGVSEAQAKAIAQAFRDAQGEIDLATKADLRELEHALKADLRDLERGLKAAMAEAKADTIVGRRPPAGPGGARRHARQALMTGARWP